MIQKFLFAISLLFSVNAFAAEPTVELSPEMRQTIISMETELKNGNFALEANFPFTALLYLKDWPLEVQRGLYTALNEESAPLLVDVDDLVNWVWSDPSGEYVIEGWIKRSVVIEENGEKVYVAAYSVTGGEWGRTSSFVRYIVLDAQGNLARDVNIL